jgi:5,6-dimethylbenzimidazole synthase
LWVDWVSLLDRAQMRKISGIPPNIVPVAYLSLGYPKGAFPEEPLPESVGWRERLPLRPLVSYEEWGRRARGDLWEKLQAGAFLAGTGRHAERE